MPVVDFWGKTRPPLGTPIDRANPLTRGLTGVFTFLKGQTSEPLLGTSGVLSSGASLGNGLGGPALVLTGTTSDMQFGGVGTTRYLGNGACTVLTLVKPASISAGTHNVFSTTVTTVDYDIQLRRDAAVLNAYLFDGVTNQNATLASAMVAGTVAQVGLTFNGNALSLVLNGVIRNTVSGITAGRPKAPLVTRLSIGSNNLQAAQYWDGDIYYVFTWNRSLTPAELQQVYARPYALFQPPIWRRYLSIAIVVTGAVRDAAARFRLASPSQYRDAAARLRMQSAATYRDAVARFRLRATAYRDAGTRFKMASVAVYRDAASRLQLRASAWRDVAARFRLAFTATRDTALRLRLAAAAFRDAGARFILQALGQTAEPLSDALNEGWTDQGGGTTNLYTTIDELTANDADYIQSPAGPSGQRYRVALDAVTDPNVSTGHVVRYRIGKDNANQSLNLTVRLLEGVTTIATWTETDIPQMFTTVSRTLTSPEAASISDYSALALEFEASA